MNSNIVHDCSDAIIEEEHQEKLPWRERKEAYISKIRHKPHESILVSCADKLHNARAIMFDFDRIGDAIWDRFKPGPPKTIRKGGGFRLAIWRTWSLDDSSRSSQMRGRC